MLRSVLKPALKGQIITAKWQRLWLKAVVHEQAPCKGKSTNELPLQGAGFVVGIVSQGAATGLS